MTSISSFADEMEKIAEDFFVKGTPDGYRELKPEQANAMFGELMHQEHGSKSLSERVLRAAKRNPLGTLAVGALGGAVATGKIRPAPAAAALATALLANTLVEGRANVRDLAKRGLAVDRNTGKWYARPDLIKAHKGQ